MGEIKSSIELALERSRRLTLTEEEREEIKRKEIEEKAHRIFHRYLEGSFSLHEMGREVERVDEPYRAKVKAVLLKALIDALTLEGDYEKILSGIEWLKGSSIETVRKRFQDLAASFAEAKKNVEQEAKKAILEDLERFGFTGSAIEPNVDESPEAHGLRAAMMASYQDQVQRLQEALRNL